MQDAKAGTFRAAWLHHRRWRWLLASYAVSMTGDFLYFVALVVFLIDTTGSVAWVAASAVVRMLAYVFLGPFGGVIADRYDRRRVMIVCDVARFGVMAALAAVAWAGGSPTLAILLATVGAVLTTPHRPATVAATPTLVAEDDLTAANAAESVIGQVSYFLGPALGALVVAVADPGTAFLVNGLTFLVSALLVTKVGDIGGGPGSTAVDEEPVRMLRSVADGVDVVRQDRGLLALIVFTSAVVFLLGFEQVVHVLVAEDRLDMGASGVGVLGAAVGVGGLLIAPFMARLGGGRGGGLLLATSGVMMGVPMMLLAVITSPLLACAVLLIEGVGVILLEVLFITLLQRGCPENMIARVFGLQDSVSAAAQLFGSIAAPLLVAGIDLEWSLVIGGGVLVVASFLLAPGLNGLAVRTDDARRQLQPTVDRLRSLGIFGEAPQAALERLARAARLVTVTAGQVLLREGDEPRDLYVIEAGSFRASTTAQGEINCMGPGEWFGEIGLLRRIPRTATVVAAEPGELLAIPGTVFLDAIAGVDVLPDPLRLTVTTSLARTHPSLVDQSPVP